MIRGLTLEDLPNVIAVHCQAFPTSALSRLGFESVRRYYEWQLIGPHDAFSIGIYKDEELISFCVGGVFRGALNGFLEKNRNFLIKQVANHPWLLFNPLFRKRAALAIKWIFQWKKTSAEQAKVKDMSRKSFPSFRILAIAVLPQHQGSGVAKLLMAHSEQIALQQGFTRMGLTVHLSNERAIRFYEKLGWQKDEVEGVWSGHMSKILTTSER